MPRGLDDEMCCDYPYFLSRMKYDIINCEVIRLLRPIVISTHTAEPRQCIKENRRLVNISAIN